LRYFWLVINAAFWTTFFGLCGIIASFFEKDKGRILGHCARIWGKTILLFCGIRYRVDGIENLDLRKNYFFASNHASAIDVPLAFAGIPNWLVSIAKIELKSVPVLGWVMSTAGHIFVNRRNSENAIRSLEEAKETLKKQPRSVLIFPEGTRTMDGSLSEFKRGGLNMAIDLGMPIVPVACVGTYQMLNRNNSSVGKNSLNLKLGKPIFTDKLDKNDRRIIADIVSKKVVELLAEDSKQE